MSSESVYTDVYIGLGSNLDRPVEQISLAVAALKKIPESRYINDSGLYLSKPLMLEENNDHSVQADYYNAVALLETQLAPLALLDQLQAIENIQGREREYRWAPRTLDLDILIHGQQQIQQPRVTWQHPGITEREFGLYPLQR